MDNGLISLLAGGGGFVLSLFLEWFPGISGWFGGLGKYQKAMVNAAACLIFSVLVFGAGCVGILSAAYNIFPSLAAITCDQNGALLVLQAFFFAIGGSQINHITVNKAIHTVTKK